MVELNRTNPAELSRNVTNLFLECVQSCLHVWFAGLEAIKRVGEDKDDEIGSMVLEGKDVHLS